MIKIICLILFFTLGISAMGGCHHIRRELFSYTQFETQWIDVLRRDDVDGLFALWAHYQALPLELPFSHRSLISIAIEFNAERCIEEIMIYQSGSMPCSVHDILARLPYLDNKELRIKILKLIVREGIFVKRMIVREKRIEYYTFLELYNEIEREKWLSALGENRYNEYLLELKESSCFRLNYLKRIDQEKKFKRGGLNEAHE